MKIYKYATTTTTNITT